MLKTLPEVCKYIEEVLPNKIVEYYKERVFTEADLQFLIFQCLWDELKLSNDWRIYLETKIYAYKKRRPDLLLLQKQEQGDEYEPRIIIEVKDWGKNNKINIRESHDINKKIQHANDIIKKHDEIKKFFIIVTIREKKGKISEIPQKMKGDGENVIVVIRPFGNYPEDKTKDWKVWERNMQPLDRLWKQRKV